MHAVQVPEAGGGFELVERDVPEPGEGEVRVTVQACGVRHPDMVAEEGVLGDATPFPIMATAWAWAGSAARATTASRAGAGN